MYYSLNILFNVSVISNHEKIQFIRVDINIFTEKFIIFVEIPTILLEN